MLEGVRRARTKNARLHFVANHKGASLGGEATNCLNEFFSAGVHAAFALNAFNHDGTNAIALHLEQALKCFNIVDGR
jgi:hypothetical protein